ncbi:hypothetical protein JVT61DRAFT_7696 [Boletus reticuloceps]|uniref:Uncharacterized protein n=1 Tax=Boletus reticuloceps TaxID=495285 RepID=A0A8I2YJV0_9AGAM|nr:hypothetical protein JVT61DRAFT_7696 [Boletus reticuloceps]
MKTKNKQTKFPVVSHPRTTCVISNLITWRDAGPNKENHAKRRRSRQSRAGNASRDMYAPYFLRASHTMTTMCPSSPPPLSLPSPIHTFAAKALELFLAMIVEEASKVTLERGSKKIEGYHLYVSTVLLLVVIPERMSPSSLSHTLLIHRKHAVETTEMLDFLKEIVESVPDPSAGGTIDLEAEAAEGSKRKRGKTKKNGTAPTTSGEQKKRRKRKADVDVDADADANGAGEEAVGGGKSEQEGDTAMDEDDDRDGYAEPSHRDQDADWRDDEDSPYSRTADQSQLPAWYDEEKKQLTRVILPADISDEHGQRQHGFYQAQRLRTPVRGILDPSRHSLIGGRKGVLSSNVCWLSGKPCRTDT